MSMSELDAWSSSDSGSDGFFDRPIWNCSCRNGRWEVRHDTGPGNFARQAEAKGCIGRLHESASSHLRFAGWAAAKSRGSGISENSPSHARRVAAPGKGGDLQVWHGSKRSGSLLSEGFRTITAEASERMCKMNTDVSGGRRMLAKSLLLEHGFETRATRT